MERRANRDEVVGRQIGRYMVVSHLATGGMAELYVARQEAVGGFEKNLVIKMLQDRYAQHPRVVQMFLDEARLAAKLNHPNIVHVYDVAEEDGHKFIAMEYIHGETLTDIVKRSVEVGAFLPIEHAVHIVSQVAAGLDFAHRRHDANGALLRIVHRDVSPSNIMVTYEGQTKIIDFGIARVQDQIREESGMHPGKASYMSPEQVAGQAVDYRSDNFSLGIILYETTLGRRLWRGTPEEVMKRIVSAPAPPPTSIKPDYPPALEAIVMRALQKRPEDRYQSSEQMRHDLEEFLAAAGYRTGARQAALYLRELFPIRAALDDEGMVQPRPMHDVDSAPLPIVDGAADSSGAIGSVSFPGGAEGSSAAAGGARASQQLLVPRGPSNAKIALVAAVITFIAITAAILVARSRQPDDLAAGQPEPERIEAPIAAPPHPAPPAPRAPPREAVAPRLPREAPEPAPEPVVKAPPPAGVRASAPSRSAAAAAANDRTRNRHPTARRQTASSNEPSGRASASSSSASPSAPSAPAPEPPRPSPPPEPVARAPVTPAAAPAAAEPSARPASSGPPPGTIESKAVTAVVRTHAAEVQGCFDRALMEHADLHGRLTVRASIDPSGRVLSAGPTAVMEGGGRLQACVVAAFQRWTFPPPSGGVKGTVTYSFSFE
jgi:tRNA A-37 threonylcarbamoyl transferase component Bud32